MGESIFYAVLRDIDEKKSSIELFWLRVAQPPKSNIGRTVGEYSALQRIEGDLKDLEERVIDQ
jgi:hypothetical protein